MKSRLTAALLPRIVMLLVAVASIAALLVVVASIAAPLAAAPSIPALLGEEGPPWP